MSNWIMMSDLVLGSYLCKKKKAELYTTAISQLSDKVNHNSRPLAPHLVSPLWLQISEVCRLAKKSLYVISEQISCKHKALKCDFNELR